MKSKSNELANLRTELLLVYVRIIVLRCREVPQFAMAAAYSVPM